MADKAEKLDIWIVESNQVYAEVPYAVVTDWIQQGRLLEVDMARPTGSKAEWMQVGASPALRVFLPTSEPDRPQDEAESLEPVSLGFDFKKRRGDDDEDVDMVPLIDVSLVLLIFFMMTATVGSGAGSLFDTPEAKYGTNISTDPLWVGIRLGRDSSLEFSLGQGAIAFPSETGLQSLQDAIRLLDEHLVEAGPTDVLIKADRAIPVGQLKQLRAELEIRKLNGRIKHVGDEVVERSQS